MSAVYDVQQPIKHAGIGLQRQPGETVHSSELAAAPGWRDALIAAGAIAPRGGQPQEPKKAAKRA